jgi:hypothetical protein
VTRLRQFATGLKSAGHLVYRTSTYTWLYIHRHSRHEASWPIVSSDSEQRLMFAGIKTPCTLTVSSVWMTSDDSEGSYYPHLTVRGLGLLHKDVSALNRSPVFCFVQQMRNVCDPARLHGMYEYLRILSLMLLYICTRTHLQSASRTSYFMSRRSIQGVLPRMSISTPFYCRFLLSSSACSFSTQ